MPGAGFPSSHLGLHILFITKIYFFSLSTITLNRIPYPIPYPNPNPIPNPNPNPTLTIYLTLTLSYYGCIYPLLFTLFLPHIVTNPHHSFTSFSSLPKTPLFLPTNNNAIYALPDFTFSRLPCSTANYRIINNGLSMF